MQVRLFNTMSRCVEDFKPISEECVKMYTCGPTVYNYVHIGNLRTFLFEDLLKRMLLHAGYKVSHVMNITDVGHLTGDGDDGEDKMVKEARKEKKTVWDIADFYTRAFVSDVTKLNLIRPDVLCKATDHIPEMIALIKRLEEKGHTYISGGNVYFSIDTFPEYGKLARLKLSSLEAGHRVGVDDNKRNPHDFVLWFTNSKFGDQDMMWDSPWGKGYPGWHIECSAMSMKYLGEQFDIHCGGIDAIPVHHTNEIAQSEAATGKKWVNFWMHGEFLLSEKGKMSKSSGEFLTLSVLEKRGYSAMDYRYFCLSGHYRKQLQFSWEALDAAKEAYHGVVKAVAGFKAQSGATGIGAAKTRTDLFDEHISTDLNAPRALADMWGIIKDNNLSVGEKLSALYYIDEVLGLRLSEVNPEADGKAPDVPGDVMALVAERTAAKKSRDFALADSIREKILALGWEVKDTPAGPSVSRK